VKPIDHDRFKFVGENQAVSDNQEAVSSSIQFTQLRGLGGIPDGVFERLFHKSRHIVTASSP
jgi:hypothetical protein